MSMRASIFAGAMVAALAGCVSGGPTEGELIADPYEPTNRQVHEINKSLDTILLKPVSEVYDFATPALFKHMISNEIKHLQLPGMFINRLLQADGERAAIAAARFGVNTLMGAGGLLDPATEFGLPYQPTDFGVTLAVWGMEEGVYHELPFFGPATTRSAVGRVVDFALDPTILVTFGVVGAPTAADVILTARTPVTITSARHENAAIIDQVLYQSDDSYVAARTGFVQTRRRAVAEGETDAEALPDLFN